MTTPALLSKLTAAQARALAVGLAVLVLLVAIALFAGPVVWAHWHYDRAIADSTDRLERLRRVAAQAPEYRKALDAMRALDGRRFFLQNSAPNLAGAELQELVKAAIEGNGGRINTSQNPAPRDDGAMKQVIVDVQFFATSPDLAKILYAIETQNPQLDIDSITVRPLNAFRTFKPNPGQEPEVNVQMDVVAWALPETPKAGALPAGTGSPGQPGGAGKAKGAAAAAAKS
jgi:general secretion pathway protein M